jgi:hypothetical protein
MLEIVSNGNTILPGLHLHLQNRDILLPEDLQPPCEDVEGHGDALASVDDQHHHNVQKMGRQKQFGYHC